MTALPASTDFTGSAVTEAGFKTAITSQRDFLAGLLGTDGTTVSALAALQVPFCGVTAKTAAYTVVASDRGKVIYYTGSGGVNLTLPVTTTTDFGIGYAVTVKNVSTGTITLVRSSTDTIDGQTSQTLASMSSVILWIAATGAWVRLGNTNPANQKMDIYTTGSGNWTVPAGVTSAFVVVVGGGGGSFDNTTYYKVGGYGGVACGLITGLVPGAVHAYSVGAGGAGVTSGTAGSGGGSSLGSLVSATGGTGATSSAIGTAGVGTGGTTANTNTAHGVALFSGDDLRRTTASALTWAASTGYLPGAAGMYLGTSTPGGGVGGVVAIFYTGS